MMFRGDDLSIGGESNAFRGIGRFVSFFFFSRRRERNYHLSEWQLDRIECDPLKNLYSIFSIRLI